jgi:hypothetical protein
MMSSPGSEQSSYADHQATWEILPWYVNGTLNGGELERLELHLTNCVACRAELKYLRELGGAVHAAEDFPLAPAQGFSGVMARIEAAEKRPFFWGWRESLGRTPVGMRHFLAAQAAAILLLVGILAWPAGEAPSAPYRTLSEDPVSQVDLRSRLHVVFDPETPERRIREILASMRAEIIAGPSAVGLYTLAIQGSEAGDLSVQAVLERLRALPEVTFAESVADKTSSFLGANRPAPI